MSAAVEAPRVDGVDVAQLLRDIGEASAQESSVELFRLCLGAQRVLSAYAASANSGKKLSMKALVSSEACSSKSSASEVELKHVRSSP